ncbi:hypothetical protein [Streptomyces sp. NBC_01477]|uniref:hypothetical protein n=1 Tax=Streptomyces sp. NBC_01477 TaxID=2976015 RepID=UPI002E361D56|nr:hypothetical protein [Streptomyces sp. NBC_01477]
MTTPDTTPEAQPELYAPDDPNHSPYEHVQMVNPSLPDALPVTVTWLQFTIIWQLRGWELYTPPADPDPGDGGTPPGDPGAPADPDPGAGDPLPDDSDPTDPTEPGAPADSQEQ